MRIIGFDLLRGLCALGVAGYHLLSFSGGPKHYGLGLFGVYVFFALSGASLYIGYHRRLDIVEFLAARVLRIVPLFAAVAVYIWLTNAWIGSGQLLLNASLLFGLGAPGTTSIVSGGWSLGIEFVFYLLTPVAFALVRARWWLWAAFALLVAQRMFVVWVLSRGDFAQMWSIYTQPLAFVGYFFAGCCIGRAICERPLRWMTESAWAGVFCLVLALFALFPAHSPTFLLDSILGHVMTGMVVVLTLAAGTLRLVSLRPLAVWLGEISYGVYLLHMPVWELLARYSNDATALRWILLTLAITAALATLSNRYFEMPIRAHGQRWFGAAAASIEVAR